MTPRRTLRAWPGTYRPIWVIAEYTGRPAETFRTWHKAGELPSRRDERTGELLVDVVAAFKLHETRSARRRAKRRAA
ncbi:hypothetical protein [Spirillospora sp. CA-294931]|uniref:hypothetical protein n=1 Tax=Spirillospora sp. CA-294931 TaxID=3240042 RepID=UPI003D8E2DE2